MLNFIGSLILLSGLFLPFTAQELYNQDAYDGREVCVDCKVTDLLIEQGRQGSLYLEIDCEGTKLVGYIPNIAPNDKWAFRTGDTVGLGGTFHKEGWIGGFPKENFIDVRITYVNHS